VTSENRRGGKILACLKGHFFPRGDSSEKRKSAHAVKVTAVGISREQYANRKLRVCKADPSGHTRLRATNSMRCSNDDVDILISARHASLPPSSVIVSTLFLWQWTHPPVTSPPHFTDNAIKSIRQLLFYEQLFVTKPRAAAPFATRAGKWSWRNSR
jgi:hypothetical protein